MAPGGGAPGRPAAGFESRYGDELPTKDAVDWVKSEAWRRACAKAFGLGWPISDAGLGVIKLAPALAVIALTKLCTSVPPWRVARCLGLSPHEATEVVNRATSLGPWAGDQAVEIVKLLGGE